MNTEYTFYELCHKMKARPGHQFRLANDLRRTCDINMGTKQTITQWGGAIRGLLDEGETGKLRRFYNRLLDIYNAEQKLTYPRGKSI